MTSDSEGSATERRTVGATSDAGPQAPPSTAPATPDVPRPPDRDARGRFADRNQVGARTQFSGGNWAAMRHSLDADRWPPGLDVLKEEVEALLAEMLADEGDASDVPARRRSLLNYRARLHRRIIQLDAALEQRGLLDRRGKLRVTWLQQLGGLIERARTLDTTLGLTRRQKRIPTLDEYLTARPSERQLGAPGPAPNGRVGTDPASVGTAGGTTDSADPVPTVTAEDQP